MQTGADFGIWGGLTEDERRALQRRQRRTSRNTTASTRQAADKDRSLRALDAAINHVRATSHSGTSGHLLGTSGTGSDEGRAAFLSSCSPVVHQVPAIRGTRPLQPSHHPWIHHTVREDRSTP